MTVCTGRSSRFFSPLVVFSPFRKHNVITILSNQWKQTKCNVRRCYCVVSLQLRLSHFSRKHTKETYIRRLDKVFWNYLWLEINLFSADIFISSHILTITDWDYWDCKIFYSRHFLNHTLYHWYPCRTPSHPKS